MARCDSTDKEWEIIQPLLLGSDGKVNGRPYGGDRRVLMQIRMSANQARGGTVNLVSCGRAEARGSGWAH